MILQATHNFFTDMSFTTEDVIKIIAVIISLLGIWYSLKIKLAKVEADSSKNYTKLETESNIKLEALRTEVDIRLKAIESKNAGFAQFLSERLTEFIAANKEDHEAIKKSVEKITEAINNINIHVAELHR